jgi:hypothetical protein
LKKGCTGGVAGGLEGVQSTRRQTKDVWEEREDMTLDIQKIKNRNEGVFSSDTITANYNLCSNSTESPQFETSRDIKDVICCKASENLSTPHWPTHAYCWFKNSDNYSLHVQVIEPSAPSAPADTCVIGLLLILSCRNYMMVIGFSKRKTFQSISANLQQMLQA